jgi:transposase
MPEKLTSHLQRNIAALPASPRVDPLPDGTFSLVIPRLSARQRLGLRCAEGKLTVLLPVLEFKRLAAQRRPTFRLLNGREISNLTKLVRYLGVRFGFSRATIWNWLGRYAKSGYVGLARSRRSDRGTSRFFKRYVALAAFVQQLVREQRRSILATHGLVCAECQRLGISPPAYSTLAQFLKLHADAEAV